MADRPVQSDPLPDPEVPPALLEALRTSHAHGVKVPPELDRAILADARAGYARRRRFWVAARAVGVAGAAAAAAVVVLMLYLDRRDAARTPVVVTRAGAIAGDVDGSGRVDMVDALVLARKLEAGKGVSAPVEDMNGDGILSQGDVLDVAEKAVAIDAARGGTGGRQ